MTMQYIRDTYGVPAKRGMLVEAYYRRQPWGDAVPVDGWTLVKRGKITRATHYIFVDGVPFHPTGNIVYYSDDGEVLMDTREVTE